MTPSFAKTIEAEQAKHPLYLGIDVGGTSIKFGLVDDLGATMAYRSIPTCQELGAADAVRRMQETVDKMLESANLTRNDISAVGLGTPGTMDIPAGLLLEPPNLLAWSHFPIRDRLSECLGLPVTFANDAGAAAFGEFWVGSGSELPSIVMLTLGTGVGGGIIQDGRSLDGEHSHGSECGHVIIDTSENARLCSCGQPGHLEAYASATAVAKRAEEAVSAGCAATSLEDRVGPDGSLTSLIVAEEAQKGDQLATQIVMETADYLAVAITSLVHTVDPAGVILGGAMDFGGDASPLGSAFVDRIRSRFQSLTFPVLAEQITIGFASLGGDAGYLGAAGLARMADRTKSSFG